MCSRLLPLFVFSLATSALFAQSTPPSPDHEPSVQSLLDRIQQLEKRISELESHERKEAAGQTVSSDSQVVSDSKPAQGSATPTQVPHPEHAASPTTVREAEVHYPSLQIRGFGDVAEVSFTAQPTGYDLNLERTIIRYDYNDYFKVSFGKYHTPVSYWNTAFHHGAWLQTTISRPEMVKIGGTFIPIHFVGLQAEGNIPSGGLGLGYNLGLGNGRSSNFSKAGDSGDSNNNRAWVANLFARPARLYGLQFGGSYYRDKLTPQSGVNFDEWIASAHLVWTKQHPELLAEYANVHHRDLQTSQTFNTTAYYVQLAYRLAWQENKWKPYYRFEYIHRPNVEPVWDFTPMPSTVDLVGSTVGVRYDITNYAAFKGEYRNSRHGVGEPRVNGAFFQTAFTF